uniref:Pyridoxal phosphate homeostasis protein n=1 Tax=Peronospora matthiolae TaxID=2874970 RepID=A0AAV1U825_9STRA
MTVTTNLLAVRAKVAEALAKSPWKQQCTLVAVSKTKPLEDLQEAYEADQRHFGENYIQELVQKSPQLPSDIKWHYIGHVQSNKAKVLVRDVPNLYMVETVDSIKIANALNKASSEFRTEKLNVMVQVNTSGEEQKSGTDADGSVELACHIVASCEHLNLTGLMTIGRYGDTTSECFDRLVVCRKNVAEAIGKGETDLAASMGMSGDFELAISCGSTHVRIGSTIFGARDYAKKD